MKSTNHSTCFAGIRHRLRNMHKSQAKKEKRIEGSVRIKRIYAMALLISIAFLVCGLLFVAYAGRLSHAETIGYIKTATYQTKIAIEDHIYEEFDTLAAMADIMKGNAVLHRDETIDSLAKILFNHNAYAAVGYTDISGQAVWVDCYGRTHRQYLSDEDYIIGALAGENTLSGGRYEEISDLTVHYYAVPIYDVNIHIIVGALFAADPQDELRKVVDRSLYAGEGLAHIIDNRGDYVVQSNSPLSLGTGNNIFAVSSPLSDSAKQKVLNDFSAKRAGYLEKAFPGEKRLVAYAPLDINDWYVFYAVPEDMVSAELKTVTFGSALVVSIATGVFILFIFLIRQTNNKNRTALEHLAFVDPVTGQRNYNKFLLDAKELLKNANGTKYAMCYSDIKDFRYLNDIFGRDVGDRMLQDMAAFFQRVSQEGEISCRLGEDSFLSLRKVKSKREIEQRFASDAQYAAILPEIFARGYKPELYSGVYLLDPADGALTLNDMLDRAIVAQEKAKLSGGSNRLCFYSHEMREQKVWETEVESRMEAALENNEFKVYFQPKIDIQHGDRILGAEALVRWEGEKGPVPPGRFIELFEKNGFILQLDLFVFEAVCQYYSENNMKETMPAGVLSVNVSRLALIQPDFIQAYAAIKEKYGIPDGCIELEFTESLALGNHALFKRVVADCKRNGFLCSMDDFGSGYSSLNMLRSIQVDILKLDRQFFLYEGDGVRGQELVKSIIMMAQALHMETIAEGIEEMAQVEQLRAIGCDAIQGYVFSKPMPKEEFGDFVRRWQG